MFYVATLISSPARPAVTDALAQKVARYLPHGRPVDWLAPGIATDIAFLAEELEETGAGEVEKFTRDLAQDIRDILGGDPVDVVIQPHDGRRKKLFLADMDSTMIGFDETHANTLLVDTAGTLTGTVADPVLGREAKLQTLTELRKRLGLAREDTLAVGDGANDIPMITAAGLGVAYHAKPAVKDAAAARIDHGDLTALLYAQGYRREEFVERG